MDVTDMCIAVESTVDVRLTASPAEDTIASEVFLGRKSKSSKVRCRVK